jgi:hypothetical protein
MDAQGFKRGRKILLAIFAEPGVFARNGRDDPNIQIIKKGSRKDRQKY